MYNYNQNMQNNGFQQQGSGQGYPQQGFGQSPGGFPQGYPQGQQMNHTQGAFSQGQQMGQSQNGFSQGQQQNQGGPNNRVYYTPVIYEKPESGKLEDLQLTMVIGGVTTKSLFFDKFLSQNGNICVGARVEAVLGDKFVSEMFGPTMVRPDHIVPISFTIAGYAAGNFLDRIPNCTQNIVVVLKNFRLQAFTRKDGSSGLSVQANCVGFTVVRYSSRYKESEVKNALGQNFSLPYYINDRTNGAQPKQNIGNGYYSQQGSQGQSLGTGANPIPGVSTFEEMNDDEELPF